MNDEFLTSNVNFSVRGLLNRHGSSRSTLCIHPVYIGSSSSVKIYYLSQKKKKDCHGSSPVY